MKANAVFNLSRKAAFVLAGALCIATSAQGFTLRPGLGSLTDSSGISDIPNDSLVIVVVD